MTAIPFENAPSSSTLRSASPASGELLRRILAQGSKGARYKLRGEIARGGMGAILRVWDEDLGRELAMKVVLGTDGEQADPTTSDLDGKRVSRFLEEAQITGQLDHPCVVPVHELGLDAQARVYFTMRLVKGRDFGRILELAEAGQEGWSRTRALGVLLRVCEAMAYAHSKGVVHRDLKPANVMVGNFGEVYVMDWGLARVLGRADAHDIRRRDASGTSSLHIARRDKRRDWLDWAFVTMDGDVVGTPAYMPPEQARGKIEEISARSDVYAIGAMLYHLLAGQMPFVGRGETKSGVEVLNALLEGPPKPLREVRDDVPAELEAICEKAMARDMADRYVDTLELAEDLRAFLEGRVVKAYQTGAIVELRKWVARNRALATAAAAAIVFLIAGLIGSLWQKSKADQNALLAAEKAGEAERKGALAIASQALAEQRAGEAAASARRAEAVRDFLAGMLSKADPLQSGERDIPVSRIVDAAAVKLDAGEFATDAETEFALRNTLGGAYQGIYRFEESERQYRIASELLARMPAPDPALRIRLDVDLADTLNGRGRYAEGEQRALSALAALGTEKCALAARALMLRASCRYNQGDSAGALDLARASCDMRADVEGPESESCALARAKLAFYLVRMELFDEALGETEVALRVLQAGSPASRVEAGIALRTRADIHTQRGQYKAARADLEEALRINEALYGDENTHVANILVDLASVKMRLGEAEEGEAMARRSLELRRKLLGDHRDTATSLTVVAGALRARGEPELARPLLEEALAMRIRVLGPENSGVGDALRRLAAIEEDEGRYAEAERLLRESTANWEKSIGPDMLDLSDNWMDLARVLAKLDRPAEALPYAEKTLALRATKLGATNSSANEARDQVITLRLATRDWPGAETLLRASIAEYEKSMRADHPLVAYTGGQLGAALLGQGRFDEAEPLLLAGWKAIGENPKMWAVNKLFLLDHLVELYEQRGDADSAALYRTKADALRR